METCPPDYLPQFMESLKIVLRQVVQLNGPKSFSSQFLQDIVDQISIIKYRDPSEGPESEIETAKRIRDETQIKEEQKQLYS